MTIDTPRDRAPSASLSATSGGTIADVYHRATNNRSFTHLYGYSLYFLLETVVLLNAKHTSTTLPHGLLKVTARHGGAIVNQAQCRVASPARMPCSAHRQVKCTLTFTAQDQPLLRMPYELSRRNFKNAQRVIEHSSANITTSLAATTKAASKSASPNATLESLDSVINKMQTLKRKLEGLHEEEMRIHKSAKARLRHLQDLYDVNSLVDVKYDEWSRTRLSRLLVDYLLREGYSESAAHLAQSKGITDLVDVDAFVACHRIERSLREGMSTTLALDWCKEHSKELKKNGSMLEFELRLQQYIELVRQGYEASLSSMDGLEGDGMHGVSLVEGGGKAKLIEATAHANKYFRSSGDSELVRRAAGLLAYKPWDEVQPYAVSSDCNKTTSCFH